MHLLASDPLLPSGTQPLKRTPASFWLSDPLSTRAVRRASGCGFRSESTDPLLTHSSKNAVIIGHWPFSSKKARTRKSRPYKHFHRKAGDGIRTHDVQLGNSVLGVQVVRTRALTTRFSAKNEDYRWFASH